MMGGQQRIAFIDLLKCACILLVVMYHIDHETLNYLAPNLNNAAYNFYLPVFYFISGIFFKPHSGISDFLRRKVNNIIVPFVFFVILAYGVRCLEAAVRFAVGAQAIDISPKSLIAPFYQRYWEVTTPLWFLLSLFWVNVIFYALHRLLKTWWAILPAVVAVSATGCFLAARHVELPLMLDCAMVILPYFVLGWGMNRLGAVQPSRWDCFGLLVLLLVAVPLYWLSDFMNLHFLILPAYWKVYLLPFIAVLAVFWAFKPLQRIPVLSHYGRYTLIILGTHPLLFLPLRSLFILRFGMEPGLALSMLVFFLTMLLEWPVIWLLKTYFPRFTALKPFFRSGWKLN